MFIRYLIAFCLVLGMVFSAPTPDTDTEETTTFDTTTTTTTNGTSLPDVLIPASVGIPINYEMLGGGFQGDMIFADSFDPTKAPKKGAAKAGPDAWPGNVIPYDMSAITSPIHQNMIKRAMDTLMYAVGTPIEGQADRKTCVYFRPRALSDREYFSFRYGEGCMAWVGHSPGVPKTLTLDPQGCFESGIIQHELLHILGFFHEQSRPDRDSYITVNYENIKRDNPMAIHNFDKYAWGSEVLDLNTPYDYQSLMHYEAYALSIDRTKPTMVPKQRGATLGQRAGLSPIDITEVRAYYRC